MRVLPLTVAAAVALGGLPSVAGAAPKKPKKPPTVCLQVTDAEADAKVGPSDAPSLDIVSGDIATGRNNLVVALRMKTLDRDAFLAGGITYLWGWTVGGAKQEVRYYAYGTGESLAVFDPTAGATGDDIAVKAVADRTTSTITWTVPRKSVAALKKAGAKFSAFTVGTRASVNLRGPTGGDSRGYAGNFGDVATSTKTYTDYAPTCLKGV